MARGLANDPGEAVLKATSQAGQGSDLFFVPDGDVFYYLGLAAEAQGRTTDAEASFREFLARAPASRWARAAEKHLSPKGASPDRESRRGSQGQARVVAQGTVLAAGPIAAPLVDVAWRDGGAILQPCLDAIRRVGKGPASVRIAIELEIDGRGRVTTATAKVAAPWTRRSRGARRPPSRIICGSRLRRRRSPHSFAPSSSSRFRNFGTVRQ